VPIFQYAEIIVNIFLIVNEPERSLPESPPALPQGKAVEF
jgi:hypothetical protein